MLSANIISVDHRPTSIIPATKQDLDNFTLPLTREQQHYRFDARDIEHRKIEPIEWRRCEVGRVWKWKLYHQGTSLCELRDAPCSKQRIVSKLRSGIVSP